MDGTVATFTVCERLNDIYQQIFLPRNIKGKVIYIHEEWWARLYQEENLRVEVLHKFPLGLASGRHAGYKNVCKKQEQEECKYLLIATLNFNQEPIS